MRIAFKQLQLLDHRQTAVYTSVFGNIVLYIYFELKNYSINVLRDAKYLQ
jgi:hypothetical protein